MRNTPIVLFGVPRESKNLNSFCRQRSVRREDLVNNQPTGRVREREERRNQSTSNLDEEE